MDTKKKMEKITKAGQPCRHCDTPVVKVTSKNQPRGRRAFYFEYHFRCPNPRCPVAGGATYLAPEAKRFWSENSN